MPKFVDAIVKATGKRQSIPAHWLKHPVLGVPFAGLEPSTVPDDIVVHLSVDTSGFVAGLKRAALAADIADLKTRSVPDLVDYAAEFGVDLGGATKKAQIVEAIVAHFTATPSSPAPASQATESTEAKPAQNTEE